jgi:hypothetical protein
VVGRVKPRAVGVGETVTVSKAVDGRGTACPVVLRRAADGFARVGVLDRGAVVGVVPTEVASTAGGAVDVCSAAGLAGDVEAEHAMVEDANTVLMAIPVRMRVS